MWTYHDDVMTGQHCLHYWLFMSISWDGACGRYNMDPYFTWQWQWQWQWICFYCHVIHIWKIQQIVYTRIHPRCYHLAQNSLKLHMAKGTRSRGLCVPISVIQGNCLMVLGKWRNAIKKKNKQCSLYSFYDHYCLITNSQIYYSWPIIT